ncbi:hypothetical protein BJX99DRAFT_232590 [Aspergillus californicus]
MKHIRYTTRDLWWLIEREPRFLFTYRLRRPFIFLVIPSCFPIMSWQGWTDNRSIRLPRE